VSGTSEGGAASVLMASMHPEEVHGLVLIATSPMIARHGETPAWARAFADGERNITRIVETWGEPWSIERFAPSLLGNASFSSWWSRALRSASSPASVRMTMERAMQIDIRPLLPQVRTRTLILHRRLDTVVDIGAARYMASRMPNATLVEFDGADHLYFVEPLPIALAITRFLAEPNAEPHVDSWIAIVLQSAGTGLSAEARGILDGMEARHIRVTPDGWTALFDAPNRALRCAERLRALGRGRIGGLALHIGACQSADGAPLDAARDLARRLARAAEPGEVLLSSTLRDILAGAPVQLVARSIDGGDAETPAMTVWRLLAPSH
jgi:class 3 adenylate cyclase